MLKNPFFNAEYKVPYQNLAMYKIRNTGTGNGMW